MAARLLDDGVVERVSLEEDSSLVVTTRHAEAFYRQLLKYANESLFVKRLSGQSESLDELFSLLMRRHRGEV